MLWWAYAGLSGSIVLSFSSAALLLGMKPESVARLTVEALVAFLLTGVIVHACATLLRRPSKHPSSRLAPTSEALLLRERHSVHATTTKPPAPQPPKRSRYALADLRSPSPEHA
jgi:hypothetical protein